jgi:indolepyruvate ferredoxin oxidoreductase alpha subunit
MAVQDVMREGAARVFMLCNEAIARGAVESDVKVIAAYPGSPTSEILDTFSAVATHFDCRMEISTNEKVALETCAGASMAGMRSITSMKSVGLNVASDSFFSLSYTGVKGGMVIVVADDPQAHSSQTEQDGRLFAPSAYVPMLEPSDPEEAYRMTRAAFDISERHGVPVLLHTSTRVNHQSGMVQMGAPKRSPFKKASWEHPPGRFVTIAESARRFKTALLERTEAIEKEFEGSEFNIATNNDSEMGIIASGAGYNYAYDAVRILGINPSMLKMGTTFPLPTKTITDFISSLTSLMVVEELSPYLEARVTAMAKDVNPSLKIFGKLSGHLSEAFEYTPNIVALALARTLGLKPPTDYDAVLRRARELKEGLPDRWPTFCPGCPHRATIYALQQSTKGTKHVLATDIGCYSMSFLPPLEYGDSLLSMGACMGVAAGLQYAVQEKVIAMIGDSTFYHAGLPGLVNAIHHEDDFTLVILDNGVTAMTGQQPHPGSDHGAGKRPAKKLVLENVIGGLGIEDVTIVDPYDVEATIEGMKAAFSRKGPNVIISRRECALHADRNKRRRGEKITPNAVSVESCKKPYACVRSFHCPAISIDDNDRKARISKDLCDGCGVCSVICPFGTISPVDGGDGE